MADEFYWPREDEHALIVGRNGTGKTQFGVYVLSQHDLRRPWVILDAKGDELINSLPFTTEIDFKTVPDDGGLHLLKIGPHVMDETDDFLWRVWETGDIGIMVDEGYMVPSWEKSAYEAILTQGRALKIPTINLSQRPVMINRFSISEASHIVAFHLNDKKDRQRVGEYTPPDFTDWIPDDFAPFNKEGRLPPFHARWYAVKPDARYVLTPVPDADTIRSIFAQKLAPPPRPSWREKFKSLWGAAYG